MRVQVLMPVISTTQEVETRRISPGKNRRPYLKITYSKEGWWSGSSGRVAVKQM
jgi:hypothetical protein